MYLPNHNITEEKIKIADELISKYKLLFTADKQHPKIYCWAKGSFYNYGTLYFPFCVKTEAEILSIVIK